MVEQINECLEGLSVAILKRAVRDLSLRRKQKGFREDAYKFLTVTLWEPDCPWTGFLPSDLSKSALLDMINRRVVVDDEGHILTKKEWQCQQSD